jgi:predicted DNA-binding protein
MKTLLSRLTPEHSERLENLSETFIKDRIKTGLLKEFVSDLTIGNI